MAANTLIDAPRSADGGTHGGSRPLLGAVLAGLGALLFVVGGLVHFYVVPALAVKLNVVSCDGFKFPDCSSGKFAAATGASLLSVTVTWKL